MKKNNNKKAIDIGLFFKKSGYKILILGVLALVILKKDLAFSINLKSPQKVEQPRAAPPSLEQNTNKKESKITENQAFSASDGSAKSGIIHSLHSNQTYYQLLQKVDEKVKEAYVRRFSHVAVDEMRKFKIPASIILAQAMLISAGGTNTAAKEGNNHFNLSCNNWSGQTITLKNECYRSYISPWRSFRNHSEVMTTEKYVLLKNYSTKEYKKWAEGLEKLEFSIQDNYAEQLIKTIEEYQLSRFDG